MVSEPDTMRAAMVAASANWDELIGALCGTPAGAALAGLPDRSLQGVLAAPAAVARWIAERAPDLAKRNALHVLVIGAEKLDAVDYGRWYQLVPALLAQTFEIQVTLIGDRLDRGFISQANARAPNKSADGFVGSLADFVRDAELARFDLAFVFHPGFQKHQGWLADGSLAKIIATGVPLVVSSYEHDESQIDRWVIECHGYSAPPEVLLNPFFVDLSRAGSLARWGRALWHFGPRVPAPNQAVDLDRLARLEDLARMVMHSIAAGRTPMTHYGAAVEARASTGATRKLVYVFDEYFIDLECGEILALVDGKFSTAITLTGASLATYPGACASELEQAIWAAGIKARHLMDRYPQTVGDEARHALGRSMYTDLERMVDALFLPG